MNNKFPVVSLIVIVAAAAGLGYLFWAKNNAQNSEIVASPSPLIVPASPSEAPVAAPPQTASIATATQAPPEPTASPIPLSKSDAAIKGEFSRLKQGKELVDLLTGEEVARKIVRAVYGLSEGRIVREYRPISSPDGTFIANKIGKQTGDKKQELYRISPKNDARYERYIALFSTLNTDASASLYRFLLPTFEEAYQELGIGKGDFHSTLIKAIDVLLDAPSSDQAMLLTQPTVQFKFQDPALEKLPSAHKLMLRMGVENSEALKLKLKSFKRRIESASPA